MEWTAEQKAAIEFSDGSAIVSAAAGSGKTAVVSARVIALISDRNKPVMADKLVLVTFTDKAAAEIRNRLSRDFADFVAQKPDDEFLNEQYIRLQDANISTISSFCIKLIRENIRLFPMDSGFSILDETEAKILKKKAIENAVEKFYTDATAEDKEFILDWFCSPGKSDSSLAETIGSFSDFIREQLDGEKWLELQLDRYRSPEKHRDFFHCAFLSVFNEICADAKHAADNNIRQADEMNDKFLATALADAEIVGRVASLTDFLGNEALIVTKPEFGRCPITKNISSENFKANRKIIKDNIAKIALLIGLYKSNEEDMRATYPMLRLISDITGDALNIYSSLKLAKNAIDFGDAENMLLTVLRNGDGSQSPDAKRISETFDYIIVDEFQDSNDIQYEMFRLISRNESNLFFVGDIKQSIYSFRNANPDVFRSVTNSDKCRTLYMTKNFRSSRSVIDGINSVFESVMTEAKGGENYDENARLNYGGGYEKSEPQPVELCILDDQKTFSAQADYVALRIREMIDDKFPVTEKDGTIRPCRFSDFAVLYHDDSVGKKSDALKNSMDFLSIPSVCKGGNNLLSQSSISTVLDLLHVIDNPYRDIYLLSTMMSPLFMITANDIAAMKCAGADSANSKHDRLYTVVERAAAAGNQKAEKFIDAIASLRNKSRSGTIEELVRSIYNDSDFSSLVLLYEKGEAQFANLNLLLGFIRSFEHNADGVTDSLYDFLIFADKLNENSKNLEQAQSASDARNAVQTMTIHKSKGLEFPICFVMDMGKAVGEPRVPASYFSPLYGFGSKRVIRKKNLVIDTFMRIVCKHELSSRSLSEEVRVLYVALTRAKEKLFMIGEAKDYSPDITKECYLSWVAFSDGALRGAIQTTCVKPPELVTEQAENTPCTSGDITAVCDRINESLDFDYKYNVLTRLPAKLTATQIGVDGSILEETQEEPTIFPRNPSFIKKTKLSGKKRGDAYHKVMELLDFSDTNVKQQLERLYLSKRLTDEEYSCVDVSDIETFLNGEFGKRVRQSNRIEKEYPIFTEVELTELGIEADFIDEKPFVQGIADMFFFEDGGIVLVDYKTNINTTAEKLTQEYHGQLELYKKAIEEMTGLVVKECYLYSFRLGTEIKVVTAPNID